MKRIHLPNVNARRLRVAAVCLLLSAGALPAAAQTREAGAPAQPRPTPQAGTTADEDFELNIDLRRINEADFQAETAVESGGARGLWLRIGVTLRAGDIDVLLRNVRGRVRFRADLAPVLRLLDARPGAPQPTTAPPPPRTSP